MTRGPASLSHTPAASAPQPAPRHAQPWPTCQPAPHASTGPLSPKPAQDRTISVARVCPSTDMLAPHVSTLSPLPFPPARNGRARDDRRDRRDPLPAAPRRNPRPASFKPHPSLPLPSPIPQQPALPLLGAEHTAAAPRLCSTVGRPLRYQLHLYRPSNHIRARIKSHVYTTE